MRVTYLHQCSVPLEVEFAQQVFGLLLLHFVLPFRCPLLAILLLGEQTIIFETCCQTTVKDAVGFVLLLTSKNLLYGFDKALVLREFPHPNKQFEVINVEWRYDYGQLGPLKLYYLNILKSQLPLIFDPWLKSLFGWLYL